MTPELQTLLSVSIPTIAVLIGILVNNARLGDMNNRFIDINGRLNDMNGRMNDMNNRLNDMNGRLNDMNNRLNELNNTMNARFNDVNVRINELAAHFDQRLDDLRDTWRSELRRVEEVIDARLSVLERRPG